MIKIKFILISLLIQLIGGCGIFFVRKNAPIAKVCYINLQTKQIFYTGNHDGIKKMEVIIYSLDNKSKSIVKNFDPPTRLIETPNLDTNKWQTNRILIKIWDKSPILEDYDITVNSSDWTDKKVIYSRFNFR